MVYTTVLTAGIWLAGTLLVTSILLEALVLTFIFVRRHHFFLRKLVLWLDEQERQRVEFLKRQTLQEYNQARDDELLLQKEIREQDHNSNDALKQKGKSLQQKTEIRKRVERKLLDMMDAKGD